MGNSSASIYSTSDDPNLTDRIDKNSYLNITGHALFSFKFDALQGTDNCISITQVQKINAMSVKLIPLSTLKRYGRLPTYPVQNLLCSLEDIRRDESLIVFINHNWLSQYTSKSKLVAVSDSRKEKYRVLEEALTCIQTLYAPRMRETYIWLDFACVGDLASQCQTSLVRAKNRF